MKVKIRYYGVLTDITACEKEVIEMNDNVTAINLISLLNEKYPEFNNHAVVYFGNGKKLNEEKIISSGSEIDCMPPFSGG